MRMDTENKKLTEQPAAAPVENAAETPLPQELPKAVPVKKNVKKQNEKNEQRNRALLFVATVAGFALGITAVLLCLMIPLRTLLQQYEVSQPKHAAQTVFDTLFAEPDWELLYNMAGCESSTFEGRSQYVEHMQAKVGSQNLTMTEVAAGLDAGKRYSIRLEGEEVAAFNIVPVDDGESTFSSWTLSSVEVFATGTESITVVTTPDYVVYVNNVPLDDSYTTVSVYTRAEQYIANYLDGYQYIQQEVTGLLTQPEVAVMDESCNLIPLTRDPVTGIYSIEIPDTEEITDEVTAIAVDAAKAEAEFAIRAISMSTLRQYFDPNSPAYEQIRDSDPLLTSYVSYSFDKDATVIEEYYRYSEDVFSLRISITMNVTTKKATQSYVFNSTYLFTTNSSGTFVVKERLEENLQDRITEVRLNFVHDGELVHSQMYVSDVPALAAVTVENADGESCTGWAVMNGDGTMTTVLQALEDGAYTVVSGQVLQSCTLYPIFE